VNDCIAGVEIADSRLVREATEPEKIRDALIAQCSRHDIPLVVLISSPGRGGHGLPLGLDRPRGEKCSPLGGSDDLPIIAGASGPIRGELAPPLHPGGVDGPGA